MSSGTRPHASGRALRGAVLAGGLSSRMGQPKAGVMLAGRPMLAYPIDAVRAAGLDPIVVAKPETPLPDVVCEVIREGDARNHPAAGILAALRAADGAPVVVVACDMPFVEPGLIRFVAGLGAVVAVPRVRGRLEPLLARYSPPAIPALEAAIAGGGPLQDAIEGPDTVVLDEHELARFGEPGRLTSNVNDQVELASADRLLAAGAAR